MWDSNEYDDGARAIKLALTGPRSDSDEQAVQHRKIILAIHNMGSSVYENVR